MPDQDWRLRLDLDEPADLDHLLDRLRRQTDAWGNNDGSSALGDDVVLTHDGSTLFAYSAGEDPLKHTRSSIEALLNHEGLTAQIRVCHWDDVTRRWQQIEPPLTAEEEAQVQVARQQDADGDGADGQPETRAVACTIGKLIRKSFEQQMLNFAQSIGLQCAIVEHPHLLSTQVAFNVTGPPSSVSEFERYLKSEARMTCRMDMGAIPFGLP
jgi:hypothetical protein